MKRTDIPTALQAIIHDANFKRDHKENPHNVIDFYERQLGNLSKQLIKERLYRKNEERTTPREWDEQEELV